MNENRYLEVLTVAADAVPAEKIAKENAPFVGYTTDEKVVYTTL